MRRALAALVFVLPLLAPAGLAAQADFVTTRFERFLDALRKQAGIPGLAAAIVQDDQLLWEAGFGYQDLDARIPATPDTPFYIADLTSTLSATVVLQCVEEGRLRLDETVLVPSVLGSTTATVGEILSHSPAGVGAFHYDPARFAVLSGVIERCTDDTLKEAVSRRLLNRFAMMRSVPGPDVMTSLPIDFEPAEMERYRILLEQTARPYRVDRRGRASLSQYPPAPFDAASGLVSSANDLARFAIALDTLTVLRQETLDGAWGAPQGAGTRFGLGWFVQIHNGQPVVWHFGLAPDASSALFIHLPARHKTLILLANSDGLAAAFSLANGDITISPYARLFLSLFG